MFKMVVHSDNDDLVRSKLAKRKLLTTDMLQVDGRAEIILNNDVWFSCDEFPLIEFLYQLFHWFKEATDNDFNYISMEVEENPLITFTIHNHMVKCTSPWQIFEMGYDVHVQDLFCEIDSLVKNYQTK